jgi:hypothetical protein
MRTNGDAGNASWVSAGLATRNDRDDAAEEDGATKVSIAVVRGSRSSVIGRHSIRVFLSDQCGQPACQDDQPYLAAKGNSAEEVEKMHPAWCKSMRLQLAHR